MEGSVIIDFGNGWACSNEASVRIDREIITGDDGKKYSKHTTVIQAMYYLSVFGQIALRDKVDVVFKDEEGKHAYKAEVTGMSPELLVLTITAHTDNQKEIIKKIKGGYNYGK